MKNRTTNNQIKEAIQTNKTIKEENKLEPRISKRIRKATDLGDDFVIYLLENKLLPYEYICCLVDGYPFTYKQAVTSPNATFWRETVNSELESILAITLGN